MNVFCEQEKDCTIVTVEGDICVPESDQFRDFLMARIENGTTVLLLDFGSVPYIDSSGVSVLLSLLQAARKQGGDIRLAAVNERIEALFKQVGLQHVFRRFHSRSAGVESFNGIHSIDPIP